MTVVSQRLSDVNPKFELTKFNNDNKIDDIV